MAEKITFPFFKGDIKNTIPFGFISLDLFIEKNIKPPNKFIKLLKKIRKAKEKGKLEKKERLKKNLIYFTPAVVLKKGRKYEDIESYTGLLPFEFDKIKFAPELRDSIFENLDCCVCTYLSPSSNGVKGLIRIPICKTVEEYKSFSYGLFYYFEHIMGLDICTEKPTQPVFISHDPDLKYRKYKNCSVWDVKGVKLDAFKEVYEGECDFSKPQIINQLKWIRERIISIEDDGHGTVVRNSSLLGGFVGDILDFKTACEFMESCIDESDYLQKSLYTYKKTAKTMISRGMSVPITKGA